MLPIGTVVRLIYSRYPENLDAVGVVVGYSADHVDIGVADNVAAERPLLVRWFSKQMMLYSLVDEQTKDFVEDYPITHVSRDHIAVIATEHDL
jgi:hypothetical protein